MYVNLILRSLISIALIMTNSYTLHDLSPGQVKRDQYNENIVMETDNSGYDDCSNPPKDFIYVYPNTASGQVTISSAIQDISSNYRIEIFNASGKKVKSLIAESSKTIIDVYELVSGMYTIKVSAGKSSAIQYMFIG